VLQSKARRQHVEPDGGETARAGATIKTAPVRSARRAGRRGAAETSVSWDMVQAAYGGSLAADARRVAEEGSGWDVASRRFLCWLAAGGHKRSALLIRVFAGDKVHAVNHAQVSQMILSALGDWTAELAASVRFRPLTVANHGRSMAAALERLGEMPGRPLLRFQRRAMSMPTVMSVTHSLASLAWPEAEGLEGASRERRCLDLVREAALQEFGAREAWFLFGRSVLSADGPPAGVDGPAWAAVKTLLTTEDRSWSANGRSQFYRSRDRSDEVRPLCDMLVDQGTWLRAGLPPAAAHMAPWGSRKGYQEQNLLSGIAISCLGATNGATWPAMIAFCCDTGWNQQPMQDLPAEPFLMRTDTECGLATAAFVASYKKRAQHGVLAYLDRPATVSGLSKENSNALWRATAVDFDPSDRRDGYAMLRKDKVGGLLDLIDRYRAMTDAIRPYDQLGDFKDKFFVHMTVGDGLRTQRGPISRLRSRGVLGRTDLSFQAIRKSVLSLTFWELGTVAATRVVAGQRSTSVLLRHYLNSDDIKAEMDQAVRLFQNILQGLVVGDREDASSLLGVPDDVLRWFRRLGTVSGVAAAVGRTPPVPSGPPREALCFDPSDENLRDLFLAHRSLRRTQGRMPPGRWRVQGLPLLAAVKAVGKVLHSKGLGASYLAAARRARRELADGSVALPPLLEC